ncbi:hypothetical protein [Brucella pituitosa]|uniref:Uncharacterized protein n=1 Tax=Brucella pituitosa TaxID=571256 RepID=A0A643EZ10_9HYPH|nr:hypothetical protein [Brucella pituitosa]KAB0571088.1 hypothetical protein F7Q93_14080 [Brucella pituitosa]
MGLLDTLFSRASSDPWEGLRQPTPQPVQGPQQSQGGLLGAVSNMFNGNGQSAETTGPQQNAQSGFSGENFRNVLQDLSIGLMMSDPNFRGVGQMMAMRQQTQAENQQKQQTANQTVGWLTNNGVGQQEAEFLAKTPEALKSWYSAFSAGQKPDWQITDIYDDQGRPVKAMIDKNTGQYNVIGGAKSESTPLMQNIRAAGLQPGTPEYQKAILDGTRSGVNVDARNMGSIPQGYRVNYDDRGNPVSMSPIPGGPEDTSKTDAARNQNLATSTDIIVNAAKTARDIAKSGGRWTTGVGGQVLSKIGESDAAELRRQVATLTANAKIENLQAMRAASPTGGALGAVSDSENAMLASKTGALDPDASPDVFQRQLDDYERTLLRVIHGKEAGDRIFDSSRDAQGAKSTKTGIQWSVD